MQTILLDKDHLLEEPCSWIFEDRAFLDWLDGQGTRFLWIHGDPGKGKTMMAIALISSIEKRLDASASDALSYFFCQNSIPESNRATCVLRGLVYLLISKHRKLIYHLQAPYNEAGSRLFEGRNVLSSLWRILFKILKDESLSTVYLIIDALDECDDDIFQLLDLIIYKGAQLGSRVKWLVTSRNEPRIKELLEGSGLPRTSLELNSSHVLKAVNTFIDKKVAELAHRKGYDTTYQHHIEKILRDKAEGTFLWVAIVFKELEKVIQARVPMTLEEFPAGLQSLYEQMMKRVEREKKDTDSCKKLLCLVTLASRPLSLKELAIFAGLDPLFQDQKSIQELLDRCGSFLVIRKETAYFVHQSAKDYFCTGKGSRIFQAGQSKEHDRIANLCLDRMKTDLKRNICESLLARNKYACVYWLSHFKQADRCDYNLEDNGPVHRFFKQHLLHWLEAMSRIEKMSDAIQTIKDLESKLQVSNSFSASR